MSDPLGATPHRLTFPAPTDDALIDWPDSFGRRFIVSVDVEEEFDWSRPFPAAARGVTAVAALPAMHERLAGAGVPVTYLVDFPVADDPAAVAVLRRLLAAGGAEIGAQLHPWVNPPHIEVPTHTASFAGNLAPDVEAAKLDTLVEAIERAVGTAPRVYRAGRYGLGPNTVSLLAARGFVADMSMRARHDYRREDGPDYSLVGPAAFRLPSGLIELPLSTIFTGRYRRRGIRLHATAARVPKGQGVLARLGLLSRVPLTPEGTPVREAVAAVDAAARDGERLLHLAFHSPSLVPGHTPYVRTQADRAAFDRWWDAVLTALARTGYAPASLDEILAAAG